MNMTNFFHSLRSRRVTTIALTLVAGWASGGLVACADSSGGALTAPQSPAPSPAVMAAPAPAAYFGLGGAAISSQKQVGDTTVTQFVVRPNAWLSIYDIGNQSKILFPLGANSICDPATSGYGPSLWDNSCTPLKSSVKITAKSWVDPVTQAVSTDFSPELRFVPVQGYGVTLFLHDPTPSLSDRIDYCTDGVCVNDSKVDAAVVTNKDGSGFDFRLIKHFSGYNVVVN